MSALREFYAKAFGWTITDAGPNYCLVQPADGGLGGGIMQTSGSFMSRSSRASACCRLTVEVSSRTPQEMSKPTPPGES